MIMPVKKDVIKVMRPIKGFKIGDIDVEVLTEGGFPVPNTDGSFEFNTVGGLTDLSAQKHNTVKQITTTKNEHLGLVK